MFRYGSMVSRHSPRVLRLHGLAILGLLSAFAAHAFPTEELYGNYNFIQGALRKPDGTPLPDGSHQVRFSLWTAATNGTHAVLDEAPTVWDDTDIVHLRLAHKPIVPGSETVKIAGSGQTLVRDTDYTIDHTNGIIAILIALVAGQQPTVSYSFDTVQVWSEEQTVSTTGGLFNAQLGSVNALPREDRLRSLFLQIEINNGNTWEALTPRLRMGAAPRTLTVDGASGGDIIGSLRATGTISAVSEIVVSKFGETARAGITGRGLSSPTVEAPGILAIGGNNGQGLALRARGRVEVSGQVFSHAGGYKFPDGSVQASAARTYAAGPGLRLTEEEGIHFFSIAPGGIKTPMLENGAVDATKLAADPNSLAKITGGLATTSNGYLDFRDAWLTSVVDPNRPVQMGQRYKDNGIVAWARVAPNGTMLSEFGVASVDHQPGSGTYVVTIDASAESAASLAPTVTPVVQGVPNNSTMRFATVQVTGPNVVTVYTNGPTFAPAESGFVIIITGR